MKDKKQPATLDDVISSIDKMQNSLNDVVKWLKILGVENVQTLLKKELDKSEKILIYHNSTEGKSIRDIKELSGASLGSINSYHTIWFNLGLMKKIPMRGKDRYVKHFNLEDFGIKIPKQSDKKQLEAEQHG